MQRGETDLELIIKFQNCMFMKFTFLVALVNKGHLGPKCKVKWVFILETNIRKNMNCNLHYFWQIYMSCFTQMPNFTFFLQVVFKLWLKNVSIIVYHVHKSIISAILLFTCFIETFQLEIVHIKWVKWFYWKEIMHYH